MRSYGRLSNKEKYSNYLTLKSTKNTHINALELNTKENGNRGLGTVEV